MAPRLRSAVSIVGTKSHVDHCADNSTTRDLNATSPLSPISPWPPFLPDVADVAETHSVGDAHSIRPIETPAASDLPSSKEIYGSLGVLLTALGYGVYLLWAFLPPQYLDAVGWTWYPAR